MMTPTRTSIHRATTLHSPTTRTMRAPDTVPISESMLEALIVTAREELGTRADTWEFGEQAGHSNDLIELRFGDRHGVRTMIVKRSRHDWAAPRFAASRRASTLLREEAGLVAPVPLELPDDIEDWPVEAYWRVPLPTMRELWPSVGAEERPRVLGRLGALIRRIHSVRLAGHGPLPEAEDNGRPLERFLRDDLIERLRPAVAGEWAAGLDPLDRLIERMPSVAEQIGEGAARLVHSDLHMGNIFCEVGDDGRIDCVGVLDLESAFAGPAEADLANAELMNSPLFDTYLTPCERDWIREGYADPISNLALGFFRAYHHLNLGFYAAMIGEHHHARQILCAVEREVTALERTANRR